MNIILDTSVLYNNYRLNTPKFLGLFKYAKTTKSEIIIPEVVYLEFVKHFNRDLDKYIESLEKFNREIFGKSENFNRAEAVSQFEDNIQTLISERKIKVVRPIGVTVRKLLKRAIKEIPPFSSTGRGFQDAVIWMTIRRLLSKNPTKHYCFITNNDRDFGKNCLKHELVKELGQNAQRLEYFNSIDEFLIEYEQKIEFIDENFINHFLEQNNPLLTSLIDKDKILTLKDISTRFNIIEVADFVINNVKLKDFYIYKASAQAYGVMAKLHVDIAVEAYDVDFDDDGVPFPGSHDFADIVLIDLALIVSKENHEIEFEKDETVVVYSA